MHRDNRRRLRSRFELLEQRELLAGDTFLVNFQHDEATTPTRYLRDTGLFFGRRGGGLSYGWTSDHTDQSRERSLEADQRFDTLIHFEQGQSWEFQLANGSYEVTVAVGDPANNDGIHTINVEGVNLFNAVQDTATPLVGTVVVTVSDGRLTLDQGAAANKSTRIDFVHIVGVAPLGNSPPAAPSITEPSVSGQVVNPADVHMEAIGFSETDGDTHRSTDWEIWTTGANPRPVWKTLGIEGVERLHTHLGDGVFMNDQAGETELAANTDYELRVRFRDSAGAVSNYATRGFHTGAASTAFAMQLQDVNDTPTPTWVNVLDNPIELPSANSLLSSLDSLIAIDLDGGSGYPVGEAPDNLVDGTLAKYLNFGEVNSGFIITPAAGPTTVTGFQITTANDAEERDPTSWALYGTNDAIVSGDNSTGLTENWTLIGSGAVALPSARGAAGPVVSFSNSTQYTSYRMVFTGVKNATTANSMQIAEIQFFGEQAGASAPTLRLEAGDTGEVLLEIEGSELPGNVVTNPAALEDHHALRIVIEANSRPLSIGSSDLAFTGDDQTKTIFLPQIVLAPGERIDLWVDSAGSTYLGNASQTEPVFTTLLRAADLDAPFIVTKPGFVIEEVGADYRLPVNIAFVPNPGPNPDDPFYFVTELYGSIQVVTRNGTKREFATGLLDYNPQGPISGSGEQGLTGLAVLRDETNPEIYHLFVGMLWDNGSPPGGATHYPKVERITSVAGGLAMASRTVLLNMQSETQGQSHQISNISIGPDGKLYVHNGDGFDASTALNLDQFRGKVLRMNLDGTAPTDNPFYNAANGINARDYVYAYGLRNPFGGAWRAADGQHYEVENGPSVDRFAKVTRGTSYGWNGSNASMQINAIYNWSPATAPVNLTFIQNETFAGSQFPAEMRDHAFVTESGPTYATGPQANGKRITEFVLDQNGGLVSGPDKFVDYVGDGKATVVALAAGPDGLYFSELYEDTGDGGATGRGARIYRVRYINLLAGDYDIDGDVDNDDYEVWRQSYGSNLLLAADGNGNGLIDAGDYTVWRDAFDAAQAQATEAPAAITAVEPDASPETAEPQDAVAPEAAVVAEGFIEAGSPLAATSSSTPDAQPRRNGPRNADSLLLLRQAPPRQTLSAVDQAFETFADSDNDEAAEPDEPTPRQSFDRWRPQVRSRV